MTIKPYILALQSVLPQGSYFEVYTEKIQSERIVMQNGSFEETGINTGRGTRFVVEVDGIRKEYAASKGNEDGMMEKIIAGLDDQKNEQKDDIQDSEEIEEINISSEDESATKQNIAEAKEMILDIQSEIQEHAKVISLTISSRRAVEWRQMYNSKANKLITERDVMTAVVAHGVVQNTAGQNATAYIKLVGRDYWDSIKKYYKEEVRRSIEHVNRPYKKLEEGKERDVVIAATSNGGVLFHEAIGHPLEEDWFRYGVFADVWETLELHPSVSVIDDPGVVHGNGQYTYDHEGNEAYKTYLIKDGKLSERMNSYYTTSRGVNADSDMKVNGHARRESYNNESLVRMSTTYLDNGTDEPKDIIASVEDGIYVAQISGGGVNPFTGQFVFQAVEAYKIKDGKVMPDRISDATLNGSAIDVLQNITMVGNDLNLEGMEIGRSAGMCGKGQYIRVSDGSPTFKTRIHIA